MLASARVAFTFQIGELLLIGRRSQDSDRQEGRVSDILGQSTQFPVCGVSQNLFRLPRSETPELFPSSKRFPQTPDQHISLLLTAAWMDVEAADVQHLPVVRSKFCRDHLPRETMRL